MIRERRNREKLEQYYQEFITGGVVNANVHPWVAESWQRSQMSNVPHEVLSLGARLSKQHLAERQARNQEAINYIKELYEEAREFYNNYNIDLILLDNECYVLKDFAPPYYQKTPGEVEGARLAEKDIGTSSISIAYAHCTPFLLFGPEMWIREYHGGDACSAPIVVNGELNYILTMLTVEQTALPFTALVAQLLTMRHALENHLANINKLKARQALLDAAPFAVYHITDGGEVAYTNRLGLKRLAGIGMDLSKRVRNLSDVVLNYRHTPLYKGFKGIPSYNKEVTWITSGKTYEDITTVIPLERDQDNIICSIAAVSMPIEDLRTLVAHAVGYTARYSLQSLVGNDPHFVAMKERAARLARGSQYIMLQGEAGSGKARVAHAIHHASLRAAGPLIAMKCADLPPEILDSELFGFAKSPEDSRPGKLELASGGTLFLDEIEKLPYQTAAKLTKVLESGEYTRIGEDITRTLDIRVVAACDSDLKKLSERGVFSADFYHLFAKYIIKIPPLRVRRSDISLLAEHIIEELAEQHNLPQKTLTEQAAKTLESYDWPGNIKQLQGVVEHAFFNTAGNIIDTDNISVMAESRPGSAWKEDKELFVKTWQAAGGNVSRMANMLDVSRVTLYRYLKKYGIGEYS